MKYLITGLALFLSTYIYGCPTCLGRLNENDPLFFKPSFPQSALRHSSTISEDTMYPSLNVIQHPVTDNIPDQNTQGDNQ